MLRFDAQKVCILMGWVALGFIVYATLSPIKDRPVIAGLQFEHFAAFALLGLAFALGYPRRTVLIIAIVIGSAFTLEALQLLTPDRHGRLIDALVKAAGGLAGIGVTRLGLPILAARFSRIKGLSS
jgi:VanZ family protein